MSDGVVLVGLPGSGKTCVGRRVAELLDQPFVDIDEQVERMSGRTPADLITREGEMAMRAVERDAVAAACAIDRAVIATGGGSPLDALNRWALMEHGIRVRLDAPLGVIAARVGSDGVSRPLLGGDLEAGLGRTQAERAAVYGAVDVAVDATADVEAVAHEVADAVVHMDLVGRWRTLLDASYSRHHPVGPEQGRLLMGTTLTADALEGALSPFGGRAPAVIADRHALDAQPSLCSVLPSDRLYALDGGEAVKTLAQLESVLTWLTEQGAERGDPLIAAGGGTVGDVGGLAAALHHRGMPLVNIPTTWLAQADSAIGGKVAVDLPGAKNAVGTTWPAWAILSDARLLKTLPRDRRRDGVAECLKCGLIGDPALWRLVEERGAAALAGDDPAAVYVMTERAARLKLDIVGRDPYEAGERRVLNLGHTIGHALEVGSGYTVAHGEAVGLGLRAVTHIALQRGAEADLPERIDAVLATLGFPMRRQFDARAVKRAIGSDKKRVRGVQRWILPMAVGTVQEVADVTDAELDGALEAIAA